MTTDADHSHRNNFGLLRLFFAICVLVSHSVELVDGNRSREPLTHMFGTLSLGEFGVDGFFLVSGYLITHSFENSVSVLSYLGKRILRIYPAFIVAFVLSIVVVGPLSGAEMNALKGTGWLKQLTHMLLLATPGLPNAFAGLHYPTLNGSMWTIPYEFRCYLLIAVLGPLGLLRYKKLFGFVLVAMLLVTALYHFGNSSDDSRLQTILAGRTKDTVRFTAIFLSGSAFYLFRDVIRYRDDLALVAALALFGSLFSNTVAEIAMATIGGYLIFWFAFLKNTPRLNRINSSTDLSYGIYLYAWPIQNLLIKFVPEISPLGVMGLTVIASASLALLSWHLIEKPALALKRVGGKPADLTQTEGA